MENLKNAIEESIQKGFRLEEEEQKINEELESILKSLFQFYLELNPHSGPENDPFVVLKKLNDEVNGLIEKINLRNEDEDKVSFFFLLDDDYFQLKFHCFLAGKFGRN